MDTNSSEATCNSKVYSNSKDLSNRMNARNIRSIRDTICKKGSSPTVIGTQAAGVNRQQQKNLQTARKSA
jgi:hypothetical protein